MIVDGSWCQALLRHLFCGFLFDILRPVLSQISFAMRRADRFSKVSAVPRIAALPIHQGALNMASRLHSPSPSRTGAPVLRHVCDTVC